MDSARVILLTSATGCTALPHHSLPN
jgi:hypothetical protein